MQIWDPATGALERTLEGHAGWVNGVCPIHVKGREVLASAGDDDTVRIWDPATGAQQLISGLWWWMAGASGGSLGGVVTFGV